MTKIEKVVIVAIVIIFCFILNIMASAIEKKSLISAETEGRILDIGCPIDTEYAIYKQYPTKSPSCWVFRSP